jgi:hypothetical protein
LIVDHRLDHAADVGWNGQRILQFHDAGVGATRVAPGLGQLVGQVILKRKGLVLLGLGGVLLRLEIIGLRLERISLRRKGCRLLLECRRLATQRLLLRLDLRRCRLRRRRLRGDFGCACRGVLDLTGEHGRAPSVRRKFALGRGQCLGRRRLECLYATERADEGRLCNGIPRRGCDRRLEVRFLRLQFRKFGVQGSLSRRQTR